VLARPSQTQNLKTGERGELNIPSTKTKQKKRKRKEKRGYRLYFWNCSQIIEMEC
jgi:hypothetical protein